MGADKTLRPVRPFIANLITFRSSKQSDSMTKLLLN